MIKCHHTMTSYGDMYDDRVLSYNEKASVYNDGLSSSFNRENII